MSRPYRRRGLSEIISGSLYLDAGGDRRDTVFVAGSGRSGTTWLSELINHDNQYRYIFEPFHPENVPVCKDFHRKQYLRLDDERRTYLDAAERILSGEVRDRWADRFNRKLFARRRLVKDIRANLLLGWLTRNFPGMPTIFLLRHPCAVTDSRLRLGWRDNLAEVMSQKQLIEDHLKPFEVEILSAGDAFERSVFLWCVENYIPLRQSGFGQVHVVFYERLLTEPERELGSLFNFLGEKADEKLVRKARAQPGRRPLDGWRERVSEPRLKKAVEILRLFGLDRVYGEDPMPRPEGISELSAARP